MTEKCRPEKFILDATAVYRMMWFNKQHPNTLYLDQRPECEPDQVADWTKPLPYKDESFKLIIFDPPHILKNRNTISNLDSNMVRCFGYLQADTWKSDLTAAAKELWRILKIFGVLVFKWSNNQVPANEVLKCFPEQPLIYQVSANKKNDYTGKRKREVQTLWFCFMKIPQQEES